MRLRTSRWTVRNQILAYNEKLLFEHDFRRSRLFDYGIKIAFNIWSDDDIRLLTDDMNVFFIRRFRKNGIVYRHLAVVSTSRIEIQIHQRHDTRVWFWKLSEDKKFDRKMI